MATTTDLLNPATAPLPEVAKSSPSITPLRRDHGGCVRPWRRPAVWRIGRARRNHRGRGGRGHRRHAQQARLEVEELTRPRLSVAEHPTDLQELSLERYPGRQPRGLEGCARSGCGKLRIARGPFQCRAAPRTFAPLVRTGTVATGCGYLSTFRCAAGRAQSGDRECLDPVRSCARPTSSNSGRNWRVSGQTRGPTTNPGFRLLSPPCLPRSALRLHGVPVVRG